MVDICTKIDLHIHSYFSRIKEGDKRLVKNGKIENTNILVEKLKQNEINMFSITDHNYFSYELFCKLKEEEGKNNCIKKVLPGVEIDVNIRNKTIHIVCIFDDSYEEKIETISNYFNGDKTLFNEFEIASILKSIGLNTILIAHQKCSPNAKKQRKNLGRIGKQEFNRIINMGYLDAVEFSAEKVESVLKKYKYENDLDNMIAITGSDCHVWEKYPKTRENDKSPLFTYIKSMPTFKGLVMAITDLNRISTQPRIFDKSISIPSIMINDSEIELSKGINAIIGDNSLGKSLLLNRITNHKMPKPIEDSYKKYLIDNKITINTKLEADSYQYHYQGSIRERFESDGKKLSVDFKDKFLEINKEAYIRKVQRYLNQIFKIISYNTKKKEFELKLEKVIYNIPYKISEVSQMMTVKRNLKKPKLKDEEKISQKLLNIRNELTEVLELKGWEVVDSKSIRKIINDLKVLEKKYESKYDKIILKQNICNTLENAIDSYNDIIIKNSGDINKEKILFESHVNTSIKLLSKIQVFERKKEPAIPTMKRILIKAKEKKFKKYKFVTFVSQNIFGKEDIDNKILALFDNRKIEDIESLLSKTELEVENSFNTAIKKLNGTIEEKINKQIIDNFKKEITENYKIIYANQEVDEGNSSGINSLIFLDLSAYNDDNTIFIIDQPEDYVAPKKISTDLINLLRRISFDRQIILVTHNPQIVVNLDVDNVILLKKKGKHLDIKSGCLELENGEINILKEVADILDGGEETIRKRWKRYEKTTNRNQI